MKCRKQTKKQEWIWASWQNCRLHALREQYVVEPKVWHQPPAAPTVGTLREGQLGMGSMCQEAGHGASQGIAQLCGTFKWPLECIGGTMTLRRFFWQQQQIFFFCLFCNVPDETMWVPSSHLKVYFNEGLQLERLFINLLFTNWALIWKLRHCNLILTHMSENNETNYRENCIPYCKRPILFIMTRITSCANIDGSYFKNLDSSFISIIIFITN